MIEILDKGGPVAWVLLGYSFITLIVVFERLIHFFMMGRPPKNIEEILIKGLKNKSLKKDLESFKGPEIKLLQGIYEAYSKQVKNLDSVASRLGSIELQRLERGFRSLTLLGNTAPLLGLLGTILGMIKAFIVIELAGGRVDAQALAGGIWEAMITTGVGLAVAIPIFLLLHMLQGIANHRSQNMRHCAMIMIEHIPQVIKQDVHEIDIQEEEELEEDPSSKGVIHAV